MVVGFQVHFCITKPTKWWEGIFLNSYQRSSDVKISSFTSLSPSCKNAINECQFSIFNVPLSEFLQRNLLGVVFIFVHIYKVKNCFNHHLGGVDALCNQSMVWRIVGLTIFGESEMSGNVDLNDEPRTMVCRFVLQTSATSSLMKLLQTFKFGSML
jgi:hypothetical protein